MQKRYYDGSERCNITLTKNVCNEQSKILRKIYTRWQRARAGIKGPNPPIHAPNTSCCIVYVVFERNNINKLCVENAPSRLFHVSELLVYQVKNYKSCGNFVRPGLFFFAILCKNDPYVDANGKFIQKLQ